MISAQFDWYCDSCLRIDPKATIAEIDTGYMTVPYDEPFIREITIECSHQKECARMMRELEKRLKQNQLNEEL